MRIDNVLMGTSYVAVELYTCFSLNEAGSFMMILFESAKYTELSAKLIVVIEGLDF